LKEVYALAKELPSCERFELASQLRRASVSILTNLAEGYGRRTDNDKANKYVICRGECTEIKALLIILVEVGYNIKDETQRAHELAEKEGQMLSGLIRRYS